MPKSKIILGIETSCDETSAAVLEQKNGRITILSNIIASSADLQAKYGGIIPEQAAREQIKSIIPVIEEALSTAGITKDDLDSIAVTYGPGLIGSLLVGVETAKTLALLWNKPLIPVNHLIGHFYANWISNENVILETAKQSIGSKKDSISLSGFQNDTPSFPCLGLLVSGGHSDLVLFTDHQKFQYLGGTRDDAAGECFDKCARLLGLPYPGGPQISKLAKDGNPKKYQLPRPLSYSKDLDFSFSGLKTAVLNLTKTLNLDNPQVKADLCASIEQAIIDSLVKKVVLAIQTYDIDQLIVAGGVAANPKLIAKLKTNLEKVSPLSTFFSPPPILCTDNGAMIAAAAFFSNETVNPEKLEANPNLSLSPIS